MNERMTWAQLKRSRAEDPDTRTEYERTIGALAFGRQVWQRRQAYGFSEPDLARKMETGPEMVDRIELGDADVPPSILLRAAAILDIDPELVPGRGGASSPSGAESWVLTADLVNAAGEEYHAFFTLIAASIPNGYLVRSQIEGETIFRNTSKDEVLRVTAQRVMRFVTEAANTGRLDNLLTERGIALHKGPPPGAKRERPPQPHEGWSVRFETAAA